MELKIVNPPAPPALTAADCVPGNLYTATKAGMYDEPFLYLCIKESIDGPKQFVMLGDKSAWFPVTLSSHKFTLIGTLAVEYGA